MDNIFQDENNQELLSYFRQIPAKIFFKDNQGRYQWVNQGDNVVLGKVLDESIIGKTELEVQPNSCNGRMAYEDDMRIISTGQSCKFTFPAMFDDQLRYLELNKVPVKKGEEIIGIVGMLTDVTELMSVKNRLEELAYTDALTNLKNRSYIMQLMSNRPDESEIHYPVTLIIADCNNLKQINDEKGHTYGDYVLCSIAKMLNIVFNEGSVKARLGGDEFCILCASTSSQQAKEKIAMLKEMEKDYVIAGHNISVSYGICTIEDASMSFTEAYKIADNEMYKNKEIYKASKK